MDFLHICGESNSSQAFGHSSQFESGKQALASFVIFAPLTGIILDFFLPIPSSLIVSIPIALIGSAIVSIFWVGFNSEGNKTIKYYLRNLKNFIYTPNMLKIFGSHGEKNVTLKWLGVVAISSLLQIVVFTPGNSIYIEYSISNKIKKESGSDLKVECPGTQIYLFQNTIECRVKTGILGITVPARVKPSLIVGTTAIKVSLL